MNTDETSLEMRWVLAWAAVIVLLASMPYLYGLAITPQSYHFLGFTHNIDDAFVYVSWMRQAADGSFFIRNLFTNEPQAARVFNVLFLLMGWTVRLTHIPPAWAFHLFRVGLGVGLILSVWNFGRLFLNRPEQRQMLVLLAGFSSGIGWLIPGARMPSGPVDEWQPEAVTFLSIYLNPLFLAGMLLMLGAFRFLLLAEQTGRSRHAVCAGICLLVLGNVHTYDVATVAAVWAAYIIVQMCRRRSLVPRTIYLSALAALAAAPTIAYQFWVYGADPVFRARVSTSAESPVIWSLLAGYGLVLVGAAAGIAVMGRRRDGLAEPRPSTFDSRFLAVWAVVAFALPYVPFTQQRKLIMGLHIPLCILCAYAVATLVSRIPLPWRRLAITALVALTSVTNVLFVSEDIRFLNAGTTAPRHPAFVSGSEALAMRWLKDNTRPTDTILAPPSLSLLIPGTTGRQVYFGHWSETPDYGEKVGDWLELERDRSLLADLISRARADYVVLEKDKRYPALPNVQRVFESSGKPAVSIYRVRT